MNGSRHSLCVAASLLMISVSSTAPKIGLAADRTGKGVPPRTAHDLMTILSAYKPDAKRSDDLQEFRRRLDEKALDTTEKRDLALFYLGQADAANELGSTLREASFLVKVVELGGGTSIVRDAQRLSIALSEVGNIEQALVANERSLNAAPQGHGSVPVMYAERAELFARRGELNQGRRALSQADEANRSLPPTAGNWLFEKSRIAAVELYRASFLRHQGKTHEAEVAVNKGLEASREDEELNRSQLRRNNSGRLPQSLVEYRTDMLQALKAHILAMLGRLSEAEVEARDAFMRSAARTGPASVQAAGVLRSLIDVLHLQGRYAEAEQLSAKALSNLTHAGVLEDSMTVISLRKSLADSLVAQGRYAEAITVFQNLRDSLAAFPEIQRQMAGGNTSWALALLKTGKPDVALRMLQTLIPQHREWLGEAHVDTAELVGIKGMAHAARGEHESALEAYRMALPVLITASNDIDEMSPLHVKRHRMILEGYLSLLEQLRRHETDSGRRAEIASEAFRTADALSSQATQSAVTASAARAAANDPAISLEIRKEQDLRQEASSLYRILRDLMNTPSGQQLPKIIADMKRRIETIKREETSLRATIEKNFPAYANLIRPQPATLVAARSALKPDEALIKFLTTESATYLWAFKRDGDVAFMRSSLSGKEVDDLVQKLRQSLDPGDVDLVRGIPEFDLDAAFQLYSKLMVPVASGWQGVGNLLVSANGALGQIPLALLPTEKIAVKSSSGPTYSHYQSVPWLLHQVAITQLPSINTLITLRKLPPSNPDRTPFVGFGDPQFAQLALPTSSRRRLRNLTISHLSSAAVQTLSTDVKPLEWLDYGRIPPLPDTRDEILSIARAMKADPERDTYLGSNASKANLFKLDLTRRKVVAFATHGLLPNDFPGVPEPSLALANPGDGTHGLLTLEEILGLKLDADWVILSACNTAAGDGAGSEAISGLGRGFFYAGTRSLLLTHWPVESTSARLIVSGIFEQQQINPNLSRAQALRQSMLKVMRLKSADEPFSYAHPLFWAPYVLVGDGAGT